MNPTTPLELLAAAAGECESRHAECLLALFNQLSELDPEVVAQLTAVISNPVDAMRWFNTPAVALEHVSPLCMLASGQRDRVLRFMARIEHGVYQ